MARIVSAGIPRIIHQTWRSRDFPVDKGDPKSWEALNPGWRYMFWSDEDLRRFMATEFPELLWMFDGYSRPVQRADLARYCLLKHYGGVYADIDTICMASLEPLFGDTRVVLCEEPLAQHTPARLRGMRSLWFNGTMASPPGHPFWDRVIDLCVRMYPRRDFDILETTGPLILSAAVEQWTDPQALSLNSSHLFAGMTVHGADSGDPRWGNHAETVLSIHCWQGSYYKNRSPSLYHRKLAQLRDLRHRLRWDARLSFKAASRQVEQAILTLPLRRSAEPSFVTVLIPARNAEPFLEENLGQLLQLDYPHDRINVLYGEGGSSDRTADLIAGIVTRHARDFASMGSVTLSRGAPQLRRGERWKPKLQRARRAGIAMARNDLIDHALRWRQSDWYLWLDADVIGLPRDLLQSLLAAEAKIVAPDCVLEADGPSFDLNSWLAVGRPNLVDRNRYRKYGLTMPPADVWWRRHLHDLRYLDRVPLNGVGGTALVVHSDVHRAGLRFPEIPYADLIETEAFGQLARNLGVTPIGLPNVQVRHHAS
ncbi:glycosyltransferase [Aquibium carbonis]|uniref:Glycosyltransferase n=1 Tax=Aquibium carbonis TaxID=2495581 RepID=A0A429YF12_9HYPH|nr:glycosyltransferase [Aquibium carbonis]RST80050.1 glycosyltransferase [Aquibium carbonis]